MINFLSVFQQDFRQERSQYVLNMLLVCSVTFPTKLHSLRLRLIFKPSPAFTRS